MRLGRTAPALDAALQFSTWEWQAAYILAKQRPPKQAPKLNTVIRLIAGLGCFLRRTCDGEPGVQTRWLGLQRVRNLAEGTQFTQSLHVT